MPRPPQALSLIIEGTRTPPFRGCRRPSDRVIGSRPEKLRVVVQRHPASSDL